MEVVGVLFILGLGILLSRNRRARIQAHHERLMLLAALEARDARAEQTRNRAVALISKRLRESDPDFDAAVFTGRIAAAFARIQQARSTGRLTAMRPFVSDGVYERLLLEMEDRRRRGKPPRVRSVELDGVHLAHVETGAVFDKLTAGIRMEDGGEFWTFLRRHGARTHDRPGLLEQRCPNCGAAIELIETARCESCDAFLRSGQHDWVLCEITQPDSWTARAAHRIPGVSAVLANDPGFSPQHLEDRIGVLFWRLLLAERERSGAARLSAIAETGWCARFESEQKSKKRPSKLVLAAEIEIRSIDVRGLREVDGWHRAAATVVWQAVERQKPSESGRSIRPLRGSRLFVVARRTEARTRLDAAVSSSHCPSCGAAETGRGTTTCAYCGIVLNDGTTDWILVDTAETGSLRAHEILHAYSDRAEREIPEIALEALPEEALPWVLEVLTADGPFDAEEKQRFADLVARWDLQVANRSLGAAEALAVTDAMRKRTARRALPILIDLTLSFRPIGDGARDALLAIGTRAGLTSLDVRNLIDQREREWDGRAERARREQAEIERQKERAEFSALVHREMDPD